MLIEGNHDGVACEKGEELNDRRYFFNVLNGASLNYTARLNEEGSKLKQCFEVKTDHPDPERKNLYK